MFCRYFVLLAMSSLPSSAHAEMVLSQVIVDLAADEAPREDIEVWNDGSERMYVQAEPFEIVGPGSATERREPAGDPDVSGLLVSPQRLVLEPGERRVVRIAAFGERPPSERVYRVAIKPIVGDVSAEGSAIKILVGYDALVLIRPAVTKGNLISERRGNVLVLRNESNTSHEVFQGRQCDDHGEDCRDLSGKRLYPGAVWEQPLPFSTPVKYKTAVGDTVSDRVF